MYLCESEDVVGVAGQVHFPYPWRVRTLEVNKVEKRENYSIRQCEVISIRGKLWLWVYSTQRIDIQLVNKISKSG